MPRSVDPVDVQRADAGVLGGGILDHRQPRTQRGKPVQRPDDARVLAVHDDVHVPGRAEQVIEPGSAQEGLDPHPAGERERQPLGIECVAQRLEDVEAHRVHDAEPPAHGRIVLFFTPGTSRRKPPPGQPRLAAAPGSVRLALRGELARAVEDLGRAVRALGP
jgi:hypothetical protein